MGNDARMNPQSREYAGPNVVLDSRGRALQPGDEVIVSVLGPLYFRVVDITPVLNPRVPPGTMHITFGAVLHFNAQRGTVNGEFVRVRTAEEAGPLPMAPMAEPHEHPPEEPFDFDKANELSSTEDRKIIKAE